MHRFVFFIVPNLFSKLIQKILMEHESSIHVQDSSCSEDFFFFLTKLFLWNT